MADSLLPIRVKCGCPVARRPPFYVDRMTAGVIANACGGVLDPHARLGTWRCPKCKQVVPIAVKDIYLATTGHA